MSDEPSPEIEAEAERFYAAAGRCIIGWSFIDRVLYDVFETALGTDPVKASIVYYRSPSFNDHLVLTDKIVTATLVKGSSERKTWDALRKRVDKLLPTRNKIAHHPATIFEHEKFARDPAGAYLQTDKRSWMAYVDELRRFPSLDKIGRAKRAIDSQIDINALAQHHSETVDLHRDLLAFFERAADALRKPAPEPT